MSGGGIGRGQMGGGGGGGGGQYGGGGGGGAYGGPGNYQPNNQQPPTGPRGFGSRQGQGPGTLGAGFNNLNINGDGGGGYSGSGTNDRFSNQGGGYNGGGGGGGGYESRTFTNRGGGRGGGGNSRGDFSSGGGGRGGFNSDTNGGGMGGGFSQQPAPAARGGGGGISGGFGGSSGFGGGFQGGRSDDRPSNNAGGTTGGFGGGFTDGNDGGYASRGGGGGGGGGRGGGRGGGGGFSSGGGASSNFGGGFGGGFGKDDPSDYVKPAKPFVSNDFGSAGSARGPRGGGGGSDACNNCGESGHWSRECPAPPNPRPTGATCYKCQQPGHISRDCPQNGTGGGGMNGGGYSYGGGAAGPSGMEDKPPPVSYVPDTLDDETLMADHENQTDVDWTKQNELQMQASNSVSRIHDWAQAGLPAQILQNITQMGYTSKGPTPIQGHALPTINAGRDVVGCAQTGSGKTAAFLLPMLKWISENKGPPSKITKQPYAIVISPTRELAKQTAEAGKKFALKTGIRCVMLYGQVATSHQMRELSLGCDVIVATMGKLIDFCQRGIVRFENLKFLVLDEADRMLEAGSFDEEVRKLTMMHGFPDKEKRQTLMFSATFPKVIQQLANEYLKEQYALLHIGVVGSANSDVTQTVLQVGAGDKFDKIQELLTLDYSNYEKDKAGNYLKKTLIFVQQKRMADTLGSQLSQNDLKSITMHGDREQRQREEALNDLIKGRCAVLVATAVAARGLDIKGVDHVIIYDMPQTIEEYVHRIGRTGRTGKPGRSTAFYDPNTDINIKDPLVQILKGAQQEVPGFLADHGRDFAAADFASGSNNGGGGLRGGFGAVSSNPNDDEWS